MVIVFDPRYMHLDGDLLVTMACPVVCDFCVYSCLPSLEPQKWMSEEIIRRVADEYSKNDISIRICGGEPFYNLDKLKRCINILLEYYDPINLNIITSGIFAGSKANAIRNVKVIKDANFDRIIVSVDRFHLPRVPLQKIINMIEASRELDIEIILRLTLDTSSCDLINKISKIIVKYQIPTEVHSWGVVGRAEKLDTTVLSNYSLVEKSIFEKIAYYGKKFNHPNNPRFYLSNSPKRSGNSRYRDFFPTTFPNGNVYASSFTFKAEYMGNINNENLSDMIIKFEKTYSGRLLFSNRCYDEMNNFVPLNFNDKFDISRNEPFSEKMPEEAIGRKFIKINSSDNFDFYLEKLMKERSLHGYYGVQDREFLLAFELKEEDLWNKKTATKIETFLNKLREKKIRFVLSRPIPPCLKIKTGKIEPKNCFECREMFTVENGFVKFCEPLKNTFGPGIDQVKNREEIYKYFTSIHDRMKTPNICKTCIYYIRRICNSLSLVK